jgi:hypothetical protein
MNDFSYEFYIALIRTLTHALPLIDFAEIKESEERFFLLRHDVEFSVEKAYELARIEHERLHINSSYFFQIRNYSYNPFSFENMRLIHQIHAMGHKIGLHVNFSGISNLTQIANLIQTDVALLQTGLKLPIDRFSFHRPSFQLLKAKIKLKDLINTYDETYFQLYEQEHTIPSQLSIYYFSDSEHRWKYGNPLEKLTSDVKKLQLLIHPYSWSEKGLNNDNNFNELIQFKYRLMLKAMNNECHNFPKGLLPDENL